MLLKYFYDPKLAQASYMVGCAKTGEALVIDPARGISPYLETACNEGLQITHVTETHIHADFVSGSRELATKTDAKLYLSDTGDQNWKYEFNTQNTILLQDGDSWKVGNIKVEVIATPGHTPEHILFQITDTASTDIPIGLFTGDCLFVGAIGRPDLLDKAAGFKGTMEIGARQQFQNIQLLREMPDYLQIWPGHGAGSACGKSLGAIPSSTLGYEKLINPAFQFENEDDFVAWLLDGQPEPPAYFAHMKKVNKVGPNLLESLKSPQKLDVENLSELRENDAFIIDTRDCATYAKGFYQGTINIPHTSNNFSTYVGWFVDFTKPLYLIVDEAELDRLISELRAIGVDQIGGYFTTDIFNEVETQQLPIVDAQSLAEQQATTFILDVRNESEYEETRISTAKHIPLGYILDSLDVIPRDKMVAVHCQSGVRSQIATSILLRNGYTNVSNLSGGIDAWQQAGLPVENTLDEPQLINN